MTCRELEVYKLVTEITITVTNVVSTNLLLEKHVMMVLNMIPAEHRIFVAYKFSEKDSSESCIKNNKDVKTGIEIRNLNDLYYAFGYHFMSGQYYPAGVTLYTATGYKFVLQWFDSPKLIC